MSFNSLTANLNRSSYSSFAWFISHRKRPVILSVVRAVAQLTREAGRKAVITLDEWKGLIPLNWTSLLMNRLPSFVERDHGHI